MAPVCPLNFSATVCVRVSQTRNSLRAKPRVIDLQPASDANGWPCAHARTCRAPR